MQDFPLLNDTELEGTQLFTSLKDALEYPEECYQLELSGGTESEDDLRDALPLLERLQVLVIENNEYIKQLPGEIGLLTHLQYLEVRDCALTTLPKEMGTLKQLTDVVIDGCPYFTEVPPFVTSWSKLVYLEISRTGITSIPSDIGALNRLEDLNLNQNKLRDLPESMGQLTNLKTLRVYGNYPMTLPRSMVYLENLDTFDHGRFEVEGMSQVKFQAALPGAIFQMISTYEEDWREDQPGA